MMTERDLVGKLEVYLPPGTSETIARWIVRSGVHFRITMPRNSVYGDYLHPHAGKGHRITVNGNLNAYSFLVTTVHEFAHLECWNKHRNYVKPHGEEWKREFKILMHPLLESRIFPRDIDLALRKYMSDPGASSCSDPGLIKALRNYDRNKMLMLDELPEGGRFRFGERDFKKGQKRRTRYECVEISTRMVFLISGTAEIEVLGD